MKMPRQVRLWSYTVISTVPYTIQPFGGRRKCLVIYLYIELTVDRGEIAGMLDILMLFITDSQNG